MAMRKHEITRTFAGTKSGWPYVYRNDDVYEPIRISVHLTESYESEDGVEIVHNDNFEFPVTAYAANELVKSLLKILYEDEKNNGIREIVAEYFAKSPVKDV